MTKDYIIQKKEEILQTLEKTISNADYGIVASFFNDFEALRAANTTLKEVNLRHEEEKKDLKERNKYLNSENDSLREKIKGYDELKKNYETLQAAFSKLTLDEKQKHVDMMFKLVETVFRTPSKVTEFSVPVVAQQFDSYNKTQMSDTTYTVPGKSTEKFE